MWTYLTQGGCKCLDKFRKPVNSSERAKRVGSVPSYGATGQVGFIDDFLTNETLVLVGEDGAPFLDFLKDKAYIIKGKAWVNNHAHILKSNFADVGTLYLMYYLNIVNYSKFVNGTTRFKLTQASLDKIPVPLPPLAEQTRIVSRIESLFSKLEQARELIETSLNRFEERKSSILHKAFSGELTKKWREENEVEFKWEETTIRNCIGKINQGWSPKCESTPSYSEKDWGVIKTTAIQLMRFDESEHKKLPVTLEPRTKHELKPGDILITRAGPRIRVGVCCLVEQVREKLLLCDKAYRFNTLENTDSKFIVAFLNTPTALEAINKIKTGISDSGVNLTQDGFYNIPINLPSLPEQEDIVRILDDVLGKEDETKELLTLLEKIDLMKKRFWVEPFVGN